MITIAARITSVLFGASPTGAIIAVDGDGHVHRLEVSVATARTLSRGQVLVLQWSVHTVPESETEPLAPVTGEIVDALFTVQRENPAGGSAPALPQRTEAMALEAALGAKPGTFSGRV